ETDGDSAVGLGFDSGTIIKISSNARMVLDEFIYDSDGALDFAQISVSGGLAAFVVGRVTKCGSLWLDTPVARVRGSALSGGIWGLRTAPLAFCFTQGAHRR